MRTRDEIEAGLEALGWCVTDGPKRTASGWKATMQRGTVTILATGTTEIGVLEDLLRAAEARAGRRS